MANENSCASKILTGIARDCNPNMGGIKAVWMAPKDKVSEIKEGQTSGETATGTGIIETITMKETAKFVKYNFRKGTGSMSSQYNIDPANGVCYVTTTLNLSFLRMETSKRIEMSSLAFNELVVIVEDANGILWLLGKDEPVTASGATGETGQAKGDGNRYTLTLTDESLELPYEVKRTALEAVEADAAPGK